MIKMIFGRLVFAPACARACGEAASAAETFASHALRVASKDESPDAICSSRLVRSSQDNSAAVSATIPAVATDANPFPLYLESAGALLGPRHASGVHGSRFSRESGGAKLPAGARGVKPGF